MRLWMVDPKIMCRQHLLGKHNECHMFMGCLRKGRSIEGYIKKGQVEVHNIIKRHDELADEMEERGYNHNSLLIDNDVLYDAGSVNEAANVLELAERCEKCRERIMG